MQVLITGGTGFIGSNVMRHLLREGHGVVCLDPSPVRDRVVDMADKFKLILGDVQDLDVLMETMRRHDITHVVHLAYYLPEAAIVDAPTKSIRINCEGTNNMFEAARLSGVLFCVSKGSPRRWHCFPHRRQRHPAASFTSRAPPIVRVSPTLSRHVHAPSAVQRVLGPQRERPRR